MCFNKFKQCLLLMACLLSAACQSRVPAADSALALPKTTPTMLPMIEPAAIQAAIDKTVTATAYRGTLKLTSDDQLIMEATGEIKDANVYLLFRGESLAEIKPETEGSIEILTVNGRHFIKGPIPKILAFNEFWYETDEPFMSNPFTEMLDKELTDNFAQEVIFLRSEILDDQSCTVYTIAEETVKQLMEQGNPDDGNKVISYSLEFTLCPDSYLHRLLISFTHVSGNDPSQEAQSFSDVRYFDFDTKIEIPEPAYSEKLPQF